MNEDVAVIETKTRPNRRWTLAAWLAVLVILLAGGVRADGPNKVGLVVVHDGQVITQCIEFSEDQLSGLEVLERSGLELNIEAGGGLGATVCGIDGQGCNFPGEDCFCQCQTTPCVYWSYWHLNESGWEYSGMGSSGHFVGNGDVEGWVWGEGTANSASAPPDTTFEAVCNIQPTPTDTPLPATPTDTPVPPPTPVPLPTAAATATPTETPTPPPTPEVRQFVANATAIEAGQSVTLSWDVANAEMVYLRTDGHDEGVVSPGSKTVSPAQTTTYTLVVIGPAGDEQTRQVTVTVNPPAPTAAIGQPTATPTDTPQPQPTLAPPTATPADAAVAPSPTTTPSPTPQPPPATATPVPTDTPAPVVLTPRALPTFTPQRVAIASPQASPPQPPSSAPAQPAADDGSGGTWLVFGAITGLLVLLTAPLVLGAIGVAVWWMWRRR